MEEDDREIIRESTAAGRSGEPRRAPTRTWPRDPLAASTSRSQAIGFQTPSDMASTTQVRFNPAENGTNAAAPEPTGGVLRRPLVSSRAGSPPGSATIKTAPSPHEARPRNPR